MEYRRFSSFIEKTQYGYTAEETSSVDGDAKYLRITDIVPYFVDKERVEKLRAELLSLQENVNWLRDMIRKANDFLNEKLLPDGVTIR